MFKRFVIFKLVILSDTILTLAKLFKAATNEISNVKIAF